MFDKKIISILIIVFFLSLAAVSAVDNQTDTVSDYSFTDKSFDEIKTDVESADSGDTITVNGSYCDSDGIYITEKNLTFEGINNAKLDGNNSADIIYCSQSNLDIRNIYFTHAGGNAINAYNSNLTLTNCTFDSNNLSYAIYFTGYDGSTLTISNCTFKNGHNSIYDYGSGTVIKDSNFKDNTGFQFHIEGSNAEISNCEFLNCEGGIEIDGNNVNVTGCIFKDNDYSISAYGSDFVISDSSFISISQTAVSLSGFNHMVMGCNFTGNGNGALFLGSYSSGGSNLYGKFTVRNCIFSNNRGESGAAIKTGSYLLNNVGGNGSNVWIDNCTFNNNQAYYWGGAIYGEIGGVAVANSRFDNNVLENGDGGSICLRGDNNIVINSNFTNGHAREGGFINVVGNNLTIDKCRFKDGQADYRGGAICYQGLKMTVINSFFENLEVTDGSGGAIEAMLVNEPGTTSFNGILTVVNSSFKNNRATDRGAIEAYGKCKIDSCEFIGNSANFISAVAVLNNNAEIRNSKFINNTSPYGMISMVKDSYTLANNIYTNYSPGPFFIFAKGEGYTVYDIDFKKMDLVKLTVSKVKVTYGKEFYVQIQIVHKYTGQKITQTLLIKFKDKKTGKTYGNYFDGKRCHFTGDLSVGVHSMEVKAKGFYCPVGPVTTTFEITKIPTTVKAAKVTFKHKKSKYFKITVKANKKPVKKVVLKVKIDKRTYKLKTDKNGVVKFNTKNLKVGKHKVTISSSDKIYKISAKSQITIKK